MDHACKSLFWPKQLPAARVVPVAQPDVFNQVAGSWVSSLQSYHSKLAAVLVSSNAVLPVVGSLVFPWPQTVRKRSRNPVSAVPKERTNTNLGLHEASGRVTEKD